MALSKDQKETIFQVLLDRFSKAKSIVFSDYRGLHVKEMEKLRNALRKEGLDMQVAKKTLIKRASKQVGLPEPIDGILDGPISATFSYQDAIIAAKILHTFSKEHTALELRGGYMEGKLMNRKEIEQLAQIPSRKELLARFVGSLNAPISGFYGVLHGTLRGFVGVVDAVRRKKESTV